MKFIEKYFCRYVLFIGVEVVIFRSKDSRMVKVVEVVNFWVGSKLVWESDERVSWWVVKEVVE